MAGELHEQFGYDAEAWAWNCVFDAPPSLLVQEARALLANTCLKTVLRYLQRFGGGVGRIKSKTSRTIEEGLLGSNGARRSAAASTQTNLVSQLDRGEHAVLLHDCVVDRLALLRGHRHH